MRELVVEVEVRHSDLDKLALYHSLGVEEIWRWSKKNHLLILRREEQIYELKPHSRIFPQAQADQLSALVWRSTETTKPEWNREIKAWLNQL